MHLLEVVAEVTTRTERRVTYRAEVVFHTAVLLQVTKVDFPPGLGERLSTLLAPVGHLVLGCVQVLLVLYQRALGAKTMATFVTLEGLFSSVDPLVYIEQRYMRKSLRAVGAGVWVGRGAEVAPLVCGEGLLAAALLSTLLAHKSLFAVVAHVGCKRRLVGRLVVTLCTLVLLSSFHVNLHSVQLEHHFTIVVEATSLADELALLLVLTLTVLDESGAAPGGFSTEDTDAGLCVSPLVPHQTLEVGEGEVTAWQPAPQLVPLVHVSQPQPLHPRRLLRANVGLVGVVGHAVLVQPDQAGEGAVAAPALVLAGLALPLAARVPRWWWQVWVVAQVVRGQEGPAAVELATRGAGEEGPAGPGRVEGGLVLVPGHHVGVEPHLAPALQPAQLAGQQGQAAASLLRWR